MASQDIETKPKRAKKVVEAAETFVAYKGFDANLQCRGYQYGVGKTYVHAGTVRQCESGFHACQNPLDVLDYYPLIGEGANNRFARVTVGGKVDRSDDKKWSAAEITITAELTLPDFIKAGVAWIMDACKADKAKGAVSSKREDKMAASGYYSQLAASGYSSKLAASGYTSKLAASGDSSKLAASGYTSKLAASGDYSKLAASGYTSKLAASGDYSKLAASGDSSKLEISGANSAAAAVGVGSTVKATAGTPVAICEYDRNGAPIGFATGIAGQDGVPADKWLIARDGKLVEA